MPNYKILHTFVGPFPQGRTVAKEQLEETGADIGRLLSLKAVEEVQEAPSKEPLPETTAAISLQQQGKLTDLQVGEGGSSQKDDKKEVAQEGDDDKPKLEDMTTKELRDLAAEIGGIDKANSMAKGELIEAIKEQQKKQK